MSGEMSWVDLPYLFVNVFWGRNWPSPKGLTGKALLERRDTCWQKVKHKRACSP